MKRDLAFYPFLLAAYPLLFFLGHNKLWFSTPYVFIVLIPVILSLIVFFALNFFTKDQHKSALVLTLLIISFYQGGGDLPVLHRIILAAGVFISALVLSYFILKSKKDFGKLTPILNFTSILLVAMAFVSIVQGRVEVSNLKWFYKNNEIETALKASSENKIKNLPNIYYIVPDEYAGFNTLKKYYNFDNKEFKDFLTQRGFYIPQKSSSNYAVTRLSLNSSLNMEYINYDIPKGFEDEICMRNILDNYVVKILKASGYETTIILNSWHTTRNLDDKYYKNWDHSIKTFSPTFNDRVSLRRITVLRLLIYDYFMKEHRRDKKLAFETLNNIAQRGEQKNKPQFVFLHVLLPHMPSVFDENGASKWSTPNAFIKKYYTGQVKYTNKLLEKNVETILDNDKNAIIVIQSDHGFRGIATTKHDEIARYDNITEIYIPNKYKNKIKLYQEITPVNIFRALLSPVLKLNLKQVENKRVQSDNASSEE